MNERDCFGILRGVSCVVATDGRGAYQGVQRRIALDGAKASFGTYDTCSPFSRLQREFGDEGNDYYPISVCHRLHTEDLSVDVQARL
jgi:hypothetical protein